MIPLSVPNLRGNEIKYLKECIKTEFVSSVGNYVNLFEKKICKYTKSKYAVACTSGTAALHLALRILNVKENDEVIVPTMTFVATVNAVRYLNAKPIFLDCDQFFNLDTSKFLNFIRENTFFENGYTINKKTKRIIKAIIPVHVFGNACDLKNLIKVCKKKNIKVIEDAAESLGTFYKKTKKHTGTLGDIGCLSFNGNKIITSGGGGMLITNNKKFAKKAKHLSTQAIIDPINYVHDDIGYNYRLTNIQAAVGYAQLGKIKFFIKRKKEIYEFYRKSFEDFKDISFAKVPKYSLNNKWMMSIILEKKSIYKNKKKFINFLKKKGIQVRSIWKPHHLQKPFRHYQKYQIKNAREIFKKTINIPCSTNLKISDAKKVVQIIKKFITNLQI
jgi:aminotransferase in exopolysaccharide biosynthesis|tara:strand:+ start:140 stop:1303 length:1164 start_codon:yes stop_codon:yes gene_type:complete